ncbi:MAG: ABC transporter ATP-binding protein/permease [Oscillospiraceae bacterium]|jgi:ATP-binding cassette subfamily B protein|nr:ABC transporter ATP-binding protein/permease [Oscillospiraceae bacterium]
MKHLKEVAGKHKALITVFLAAGIFCTFLANYAPFYFQRVVDNFANGTLTAVNIVVYSAVLFADYIMGYLRQYPERKLDDSIVQSLKLAALRKMSVIDYLTYTKLGTGALIQRIENGAAAGRYILNNFYLRLARDLVPSMIFSIVFVFIINRTIMIALVISYIIMYMASNLLLKALYKVKERILVNEEKFNHFLVRGFMELVVFRTNRRFAKEIAKTEAASKEIISSAVKMLMVHEAFFTICAFFVFSIKIGLIVYGWITGDLTIGQIVALLVLVDRTYEPIAVFNVVNVYYKLEKIAFARYTEFLDAKEDARLTQGEEIGKINGNISFINTGFNYDGREIFNDFSFHIGQGKTTALVGESGSGKSTAVKLIVGLLQPHSGRIEVDGFDLSKINLNSYYKHIAYLPQEPPVFNGTLRENLVFDDAADDAMLMMAIEKAGLSDLYAKLEKGLDTILGERGVNLSGGERQQLALARLWFSDASIVIFDEATSAIDNLTEEAVMQNVMNLLAGKTVIAIAHRLDSIKTFDNIFVFQDGRIIEQGCFSDLMDKRQSFYDLYNRTNCYL